MYDSDAKRNITDTAVKSGGQDKQGDSRNVPQQDKDDTVMDDEATQGGLPDTNGEGGKTEDRLEHIDGLSGEEEIGVVNGLNFLRETEEAIAKLPPSSINNSRKIVRAMIEKYRVEGGEILRQEIKNIIGIDLGEKTPDVPF